MITAAELITRLKRHLHSDSQYSDAVCYELINQAQRRIVHDCPWGLGVKQGTITTEAETQEYSLPADFFQAVSIWETTQSRRMAAWNRSDWVSYVESRATIQEGTPYAYCIFGFSAADKRWKIRFYPTPDAELTIKVFYYFFPADAAAANEEEELDAVNGELLDAGWDELVMWAALMLAREHTDVQGYNQAFSAYRSKLGEFKSYRADQPDYRPGLRDTGAHGGGSTLELPDTFPSR